MVATQGTSWSDPEIALEAVVVGVSAVLSIIGATLIITTYLAWKDMRTTLRALLCFLSVCDLFTALGNAMGILGGASRYRVFCVLQSALTTYSSLGSFFWTTAIAFYLYLSMRANYSNITTSVRHMDDEKAEAKRSDLYIYRREGSDDVYWFQRKWIHRILLLMIHMCCWGLPAVIISVALGFGVLGHDLYSRNVGWCWIANVRHQYVWGLFTGKAWEVAAYAITLVMYFLTRHLMGKAMTALGEEQQYLLGGRARVGKVKREADNKLILVPLVFIFVRIWGTVRFFLDMGGIRGSSIYWLTVLQGAGDSAQGSANFLLFCVLNSKVRRSCASSFRAVMRGAGCFWGMAHSDDQTAIIHADERVAESYSSENDSCVEHEVVN